MLFKQRGPIFLFFHSLFFSEMYFDPYRTQQMLQGKSSADCTPPDLSLCGECLSDLSDFFHADEPLFIRFNAVFRRIAQLLIKLYRCN